MDLRHCKTASRPQHHMLKNSYSTVSKWNKSKATVKTREKMHTYMQTDCKSTIFKQLNYKMLNALTPGTKF